MEFSTAPMVLLALLMLPFPNGGDNGTITAAFGTATAAVAPAPEGRRQIELPSLEYAFSVVVRCESPMLPARLSITVADTRKLLELTEDDESRNVDASLKIPASQLAPISTDGFCVIGDDASRAPLLLKGVLTTSLSLRCSGDNGDAIHYASESLAVKLECVEPDADYEASSADATDR